MHIAIIAMVGAVAVVPITRIRTLAVDVQESVVEIRGGVTKRIFCSDSAVKVIRFLVSFKIHF